MDKPPGRPGEPDAPDFPEAIATQRPRWRLQLVWLVPLVAVLIGGWLAVQSILEAGPTITISFETADGLEAGKTKIKFKNVDIGVIKKVTLAPDDKSVIATAELTRNADRMLVTDTRFWVVRPRISGGTVSGIGTLLSGSYVGVDIGTQHTRRTDFVGLEAPPVFSAGVPGREFVLKSEDLGSLDVGSPVFFRRLQVGQVTSYQLDPSGTGMILHVFVNAPYDKYVTNDTRFWHASGVDVSLDTTGVKINTESVVSILIGGLAFQAPPDTDGNADKTEAKALTTFALFGDRAEAMKQHDNIVDRYVLNFKESVRGLLIGAPVDFRGIVIGEVAAIRTHFDPVTKEFSIPVEIRLFPERFTSRFDPTTRNGTQANGGRIASNRKEFAEFLVTHGLRAQLRTASLLTGQLYVAMDFFPAAPKATIDWNETIPELPTIPGNLQGLQESINTLLTKLNKIPFEGIGRDLHQTLADADSLVKTLDTQVAPEARATLAAAHDALVSANRALQSDSPIQQSTADTMRELSRTAASFRALADYLERHPEALIRGKTEDKP
jgi:paraquat-inducible protein B